MSQVFISYSRNDRNFAELLIRELRDAGIVSWIDSEQIRVGTDWKQDIDNAIRESFALLLVMSPNAKNSEYVTYEWSYALGYGLEVLPLYINL